MHFLNKCIAYTFFLLFIFSYPCMIKKLLFWVKFLKLRVWWIYSFLSSLNQNIMFKQLVSVCVSVYYLWAQLKNKCYRKTKCDNSIDLYHIVMVYEICMKIGQIDCVHGTQMNSNTFKSMDRISFYCILLCLNWMKLP